MPTWIITTTKGRTGGKALLLCLTIVAALLVAAPTQAAPAQVTIQDNRFDPPEVRIQPGDTVTWSYPVGRNRHTVTSDEKGLFDSGVMTPGDTFSHTFDKKGYYVYFCKQHGGRGGVGMHGVVIVGDAEAPGGGPGGKSKRPVLKVPSPQFPTIQYAVDHARPRSTILIAPGEYHESVHVTTSGLTIRGRDRFRTVLTGDGERSNGILIDGAKNVKILDMTVRDYQANGIYFTNSTGYTIERVDSIKNAVYGLYAFHSYDGVIRDSFAWGSGDAGIYIGECLACSALIDGIHAEYNLLGYSGTNATGVIIRNSEFMNNAVGIFPNSLALEGEEPNRGTHIYGNVIKDNNNADIKAASIWEEIGVPTGTGVWLYGVHLNTVEANAISDHERYGVLISEGMDDKSIPMDNTTIGNVIRNSGMYDLAWDGSGANNCFSNNDITGATAPPDIQQMYACDKRPFAGVPFPPVQADVAAAMAAGPARGGKEAPEPDRPDCQSGRPGCKTKP
jgi:plastocyanin